MLLNIFSSPVSEQGRCEVGFLPFRVEDLGFRVWGLGWGWGLGEDLGCNGYALGFKGACTPEAS